MTNLAEPRLWMGEIVLAGPGNVGVSMTVEAAEETGRRLLNAASPA
jgi:hypothetical protein